MNDEERKALERDVQYAIETMKVLCGTILAADAELKRLREENKEYAQEVSHLHMRINDIKHGHDD